MIYLDTASTAEYSEKDNIIVETMTNAMKEHWSNPSSLYTDARKTRQKIDECRENIANFINAYSDEIYFTSGGSEANNWALQGFIRQCEIDGAVPIIVTSAIEHKSILECLSGDYPMVKFINVDKYGTVDINQLENELKIFQRIEFPHKILVSIQYANNEIGTIQSIKTLAELAHRYGAIFHTDAVQMFGKQPINVVSNDIDLMSVSGHKVSPVLKGIGFLYMKRGIEIQPLIYGSQEFHMRGGTENTFGIIGLDEAIKHCNLTSRYLQYKNKCRDVIVDYLKNKFNCKLNGLSSYRLSNNINVTFPQYISGESLLYTLDMSGICVSVGSACNSKNIEPSHVLKAIGLSDEEAMRTIRITLPDNLSKKDANIFAAELKRAIKLLETNQEDDINV